jgi:glycosyltransferase involved in cell wall biosynthesis
MNDLSLSVIIPAFNESESIVRVVEEAHQILDLSSEHAEIVLVDDGSTDGTADLMDGLAHRFNNVRVVRNPRNLGMGAALKAGFGTAVGERLTFVPGDGQFDLGQLLAAIPLLESNDAIFARRRARPEFSRNAISFLFHAMIRVLYRFDARDYCGLYIIKRDVYRSFRMVSSNVFFNIEVALRFARTGLSGGEIWVDVLDRQAGVSKVANPRTLILNTIEVIKFRFSR